MRAPLLTVVALLALATRARAAEVSHTLREGETLQQVARYYYGAGWKASYITGRNGLSAETEAKTGKSYFIPASATYKIRKGDSLASIAKRELGDKERYRFIMAANNIADINDLEVGRELLMPFVIKHTVTANESLSSISKLYFHSTKQAKLLQDYNGLPTSTAALGAKILVPIADKETLETKKKSPMPKGAAVTAVPDEPPPEEAKSKDPPLAVYPLTSQETSLPPLVSGAPSSNTMPASSTRRAATSNDSWASRDSRATTGFGSSSTAATARLRTETWAPHVTTSAAGSKCGRTCSSTLYLPHPRSARPSKRLAKTFSGLRRTRNRPRSPATVTENAAPGGVPSATRVTTAPQ